MAYFECVIGSATSGSGIPLVATCTSAFAGLPITCSDGTTTLTETCPSASPYEVTFNLPNTGTWIVSGTISGTTYSESVLVNEFDCELKNNIDVTVTVYSANNDTISYTGLDGQTHTITTNSSGQATASITIAPNGSTFTFTSSVAKDPSNLSESYTKSITINSNTTTIYVMPDKALYWYGYYKETVNKWKEVDNANCIITDNTNYVYLYGKSSSSTNYNLVALCFNKMSTGSTKLKIHCKAVNATVHNYGTNNAYPNTGWSIPNSIGAYSVGMNNGTIGTAGYPMVNLGGGTAEIYAIWLE